MKLKGIRLDRLSVRMLAVMYQLYYNVALLETAWELIRGYHDVCW